MTVEAAKVDDDFDIEIEGEDDDAPIIEVVDTTPDPDKGKELLSSDKEVLDDADEEEIASYSKGVQKRIKDVTFKFHDQRRKREMAERERDEAIKFTQEALKQKQQYEAALYQYEAGFVDQAKSRVEVELSQAKAAMKTAFDVGDADKMAEAQATIAKLSVQQDQFARFSPREAAAQQETYTPPVQHRPAADDADKFLAWREKNQWFDNDETLKDFAMGIHTRIATSNPEMVGSEEYYRDIEKRTRAAFPNKFQTETESRTRNSSPVAGVTRTTGAEKTRKTIRLSREQMALCRKLGITPQDYVREMAKDGE